MEKKGTKIAYFVALAVVVVALVIAKVTNDGSGFVATGWALFPPVVAIALALISKEVYSSLFLGCVAAALLLANFQPWQMVVNFIGAGEGVGMINAIDISILIFLVILGIMVDLMNKAGGSAAFGRWAKKAVKTRSGAQLLTMLLGVLIFIDDYFNCLTVGAVMRPVTESHKISRAKLAYIIDATAAPVCMLAPVSSWAAAVASYVPDGFPGSRISMFLSQIPFNYYCILTLVMVIVTSLLNIDYGPMLTHEYNAQVKDDLFTTPERPFAGADDYEEGEKHSSVLDLLVPVIVLIALCIVGLIWTGGMWDAESDNYGNFIMSFSDASAGTGLCLGSIIAIVFTFVYYWCRGLIGFNKSMEAIPNGFIQMISPILILCFAWTLCGLCRDNGLQVGSFVEGVMANTGSLAKFLPAVIFIVACFIGFATGTSWGTIGIMVPLVCAVFDWDTQMTLLSVGLAASCAGGVCGDHHHGFCRRPLLPPEPCGDAAALWHHRGCRFLRQLHHCRSGPERCGLHDHRHRADGRYSAGHQGSGCQEARRRLCRNGRGQQGALSEVSDRLSHTGYAPGSAGGIFLYSENLSSRPGFEIFSLLLLSSSAEPRKPPKSGLTPLSGAGMLPHSERDHTAAHRGGHMVSVLCTDSFCCTR